MNGNFVRSPAVRTWLNAHQILAVRRARTGIEAKAITSKIEANACRYQFFQTTAGHMVPSEVRRAASTLASLVPPQCHIRAVLMAATIATRSVTVVPAGTFRRSGTEIVYPRLKSSESSSARWNRRILCRHSRLHA